MSKYPLTILKTTHRILATKVFKLLHDNTIQKTSYGLCKYFLHSTEDVSNIHELSKILFYLENKQNCFIIRGQVRDEVDTTKAIHRRKANFEERPQPWILIDIDALKKPKNIDPIKNPERAVKYTIQETLPVEFQNVTCHWQFSSSQSIPKNKITDPAPEELRLHIWFWLDKPLGDKELGIFFNENKDIDKSLFRTVQPHYTSKPILIGFKDPIQKRSGILLGQSDKVILPSIKKEQITQLKTSHKKNKFFGELEDYLNNMGDHKNGDGFYKPILQFSWRYVSQNYNQFNAEELKFIIREKIDKADKSKHSLVDIEHYKSDAFLDSLIKGAIEKQKDSVKNKTGLIEGVPPYFIRNEITAEEAQKEIKEFFLEFINWGRI